VANPRLPPQYFYHLFRTRHHAALTEKMLGHELVGVMAIYNKHDWLSDQKEAYEKFAEALFAQVQKELEHEKVVLV
jgi:hypothetical protein